MKLSIIIPVYNEKNTIQEILNRVLRANTAGMEKEIIIVDDSSTDGTRSILSALGTPFRVVLREKQEGKGAAVREGLKLVSGDIILIQDADLEYDPREYAKLLAPFLAGEADVVYGSRNLIKNPASSSLFYWGGRAVTAFANMLYGSSLTDLPTGYKVFRKDLILGCVFREKGFEFCEELTAKFLKRDVRVLEIPISYYPRTKKEGKKLGWIHGLRAVATLIRERIYGDYEDFWLLDVFIRYLRERQVKGSIPSDAKVLDIGCGNGHFLFSLQDRIKESVGIDPTIVRSMRFAKFVLHSHTAEEFLAEQKNCSFDAITMLAVLEHLENPDKVLRECFRVLAPGGLLLATTPTPLAEPILDALARVRFISHKEIEDHKRHFSKRVLRKLLCEAGFSSESITIKLFELGMNISVFAKRD